MNPDRDQAALADPFKTSSARPPLLDASPPLQTAHRAVIAVSLALLVVALWCLTHHYLGLIGDAELYAVQALSRIHVGLQHDVFLIGASQDRFTIFSSLYSAVIFGLGLHEAAIFLLLTCKTCFYIALWLCSRKLFDSRFAWLTVILLVLSSGDYGAFHVFRVSEDMLTARSMAEALAALALCLDVRGRSAWAFMAVLLGLLVHPLMVLPMAILIAFSHLSQRSRVCWTILGITGVLILACIADTLPHLMPTSLRIVDTTWLEMIRERSQFVFPQLWRFDDWALNVRWCISLALSVVVLKDQRVRSFGASALLVGASGLAISSIAGMIGPVAILLQGQAWRWVWVSQIAASLLVLPTIFAMRSAKPVGGACAALLSVGVLIDQIQGTYCMAAALLLWTIGGAFSDRSNWPLKTVAWTGALAAVGWTIVHAASTSSSPLAASGSIASRVPGTLGPLLGLEVVQALAAYLLWRVIRATRSVVVSAAIAVALGITAALAAPTALKDPRIEGAARQLEEFADWRASIPVGANVYVAERYYSAAFAWFTLERPSYLTVDQSSGIIFSRLTAMEIGRRTDLLSIIDGPNWRLMMRRSAYGGRFDARALPLTAERLRVICADDLLGFVVSKEDVGFAAEPHDHAGPYRGWNLYDCGLVRSAANR